MSDCVLSEVKDGVRTISLNRPEKLNAVNRDIVAGLLDALRDAHQDVDTRAILFRGNGRAFCAGYDLDSHDGARTEEDVRIAVDRIQAITREIVLGNKVVIGAIQGWAVGAGFEWAINCDLALWGEKARGFFPELQWGLFVTGAVTAIAPRMTNLANIKELILLHEKQSAQRLHELGIAWRVVPEEQLDEQALAIAQHVANLPPNGVTHFKRIINRAAYGNIETALALETEAAVRTTMDAASAERIKQFGS